MSELEEAYQAVGAAIRKREEIDADFRAILAGRFAEKTSRTMLEEIHILRAALKECADHPSRAGAIAEAALKALGLR